MSRKPCAVVGCKSSEWKKERRRHRLPRDENQRVAWLERIGVPATHPDLSRVNVCGRHFTAQDYSLDLRLLSEMNSDLNPMLKPHALPTRFLPMSPFSACSCCPAPPMHTVGTQTTEDRCCCLMPGACKEALHSAPTQTDRCWEMPRNSGAEFGSCAGSCEEILLAVATPKQSASASTVLQTLQAEPS